MLVFYIEFFRNFINWNFLFEMEKRKQLKKS